MRLNVIPLDDWAEDQKSLSHQVEGSGSHVTWLNSWTH